MAKTKEEQAARPKPTSQPEQAPQQEKQILVFSTRLYQDIRTAYRQLDEGQGQEDLTISKEVEAWLKR